MRENFPRALKFVLAHEGGYSNNPKDPGGETNFGISKRAHPSVDIKALTPGAAGAIYLAEYWVAAGCDQRLYPYDVVTFDTAVNMGVARAVELIEAEGERNWRDLLISRINWYADAAMANRRKKLFLHGWVNRCCDLWEHVK